ncbi:hypothetical protein D3C87_144700 [compost metagenome]
MKQLMIVLAMIAYTGVSFADMDSIETEMFIGDSEEAKLEAAEQKKFLAQDKAHKEELKKQAKKSAEEAKLLEAAAIRESEAARKEKIKVQAEIVEIKKQIQITEARKVVSKKKIQASKAEIAKQNKERDIHRAKKQDTDKDLAYLNNEAANFERYVQEAKISAIKAQQAAFAARKKLAQTQADTERNRLAAQKKAEHYRTREAQYQAQAQGQNPRMIKRSISSEQPSE